MHTYIYNVHSPTVKHKGLNLVGCRWQRNNTCEQIGFKSNLKRLKVWRQALHSTGAEQVKDCLKVWPANCGHLNKKNEMVSTAEVFKC